MNHSSKEREAKAQLRSIFKDIEPITLDNLLIEGNKIRQKINDNMGTEFVFDTDEMKALEVANLYDILMDPDINLEEE